ncbi:MAG TPA: DUF1080 domain-containing protein [Urbifossiella sp.]|nr:DUF1080 domain-containing protein [Urbifossiella sp.]
MRFLLLVPAVLAASLAPAADPAPIKLFNGKDLTGWKAKNAAKNQWQACAASWDEKNPTKLVGGIDNSPDGSGRVLAAITGGGSDLFTEAKFGDMKLEVEFMLPKGSNSGIYVMGEYEVQVLDSFGKPADKLGMGDLGALYSAAAPKVNAAKKPGEWQKFEIDFQAPRFENGKKTANAKFRSVVLNGTHLHKDVEMKGATPGGLTGKEAPEGPLMLQGDHGPVVFRNLTVTPAAAK